MSIFGVEYENIGGGTTTGAAKSGLETSDLNGITDANPLVIEGDFTGANLYFYGRYSSGSSYTNSELKTNITLGSTYELDCGTNPNNTFHCWRNVKVYADRMEIGSCFYGQNGSQYPKYPNQDGTMGHLVFIAAS